MTQTEHLNTEVLVEMYYDEAAPGQHESARKHLQDCAECATAYRGLENDLKTLWTLEAPERGEDYGAQMWRRVAMALPAAAPSPRSVPRPAWKWRPWMWMGLSYAAGCAVLASSAFYVGARWEHRQHLKREAARAAEPQPAAPQKPKVVVVVLGDHLDRSERLLVELKHADPESSEQDWPLRDEARGLLAANQVFRDDAEKSGDETMAQALDKLQQLLEELANQPGGLNAASLEHLQQQMANEGLLFKVRVLRSKNPLRDASVRVVANGGKV